MKVHLLVSEQYTDQFYCYINFSQALYKLPEDGRRPKHVGAIMCILM